MKKRIIVFCLLVVIVFTIRSKAKLSLALSKDVYTTQDEKLDNHIYSKDNYIYKKSVDYNFNIDDFDSIDDYKSYLAKNNISVKESEEISEFEKTNNRSKKSVKKATTIGDRSDYMISGLISNNAIQKTYIDGDYLYVLQRDKYNMYLTKCSKNDNTKTATATSEGRMVLENFGHSQTLELYNYNGKNYFLIACSQKKDTDTGAIWSTEIGCIEFVGGTTVKTENVHRLTNVVYACEKSDLSISSIKRTDAALSSNNEYLLIWFRTKNNIQRFSVYDFEPIKILLNSNITTSCSSIRKYRIGGSTGNVSSSSIGLVDGSNQGMELSNNRSIYIASGMFTKKIIKLRPNLELKTRLSIDGFELDPSYNGEIEGLQIKGSNLYFGIAFHMNNNIKKSYVYHVPKSYLD